MGKVEKILVCLLLLTGVLSQNLETLLENNLQENLPSLEAHRKHVTKRRRRAHKKHHHRHHKKSRSLNLMPTWGQGIPSYNQYNMPGAEINPALFSSPFFPRYGSSSMIPPPPPIFHTGQLPIQSIYNLHYPTVFTPNSMYGLPHVYNPFFATNLPYSYLHHPYASQMMTHLGFMNQNMYNPNLSGQMTIPNMGGAGAAVQQGVLPGTPGNFMNPNNSEQQLRSLVDLVKQAPKNPMPDFKHLKINKQMIQRFLQETEKKFAEHLVNELEQQPLIEQAKFAAA